MLANDPFPPPPRPKTAPNTVLLPKSSSACMPLQHTSLALFCCGTVAMLLASKSNVWPASQTFIDTRLLCLCNNRSVIRMHTSQQCAVYEQRKVTSNERHETCNLARCDGSGAAVTVKGVCRAGSQARSLLGDMSTSWATVLQATQLKNLVRKKRFQDGVVRRSCQSCALLSCRHLYTTSPSGLRSRNN